jgi:hypothetical protein
LILSVGVAGLLHYPDVGLNKRKSPVPPLAGLEQDYFMILVWRKLKEKALSRLWRDSSRIIS